ncbi:MAG: hypothetical protein AABX31_02060 [Nanoarchaeota archaeon]
MVINDLLSDLEQVEKLPVYVSGDIKDEAMQSVIEHYRTVPKRTGNTIKLPLLEKVIAKETTFQQEYERLGRYAFLMGKGNMFLVNPGVSDLGEKVKYLDNVVRKFYN